MKLWVEVYVDGSPSKIAIILDGKKHIFSNDGTGPLEIEYKAFIKSLELLSNELEYVIHTDNQSLVARMNCDHTLPSSKFDEFHKQVINLINEKNLQIHVKWVPRKKNPAGKLI